MVEVEQLKKRITRLEEELTLVSSDIIRQFPVEGYINDVKSHIRFRGDTFFGRKRKRILDKITSVYNIQTVSLYHKLALCFFIRDSLERLIRKKMPDEILNLYHEWFERVLGDFSIRSDDYYNHNCNSYLNDVGVCSLRIVPVGGAWAVHIRRIGMEPLFSSDVGQCADYLRCVLLKTHGFTSFCVIHTVLRYISHFSREEMDLSYLRIAKLMKLNPHIKGIYRRSWFLDPKLEDISPNLAFLRQTPQQNGAKLFKCSSTQMDIKRSLAISPVRRKLYAEGKYVPTVYAYIWPRKDFLEWADRTDVHLHSE